MSAVQKIHQEWWEWIFSTKDGSGHPLKGNHAVKQAMTGEYLLSGTLPNVQTQDRQIKVPARAKIFIPIDNVICTEALKDQIPLDMYAKQDADGAKDEISVALNGEDWSKNIFRIHVHKFNLDVKEPIDGTQPKEPGYHPIGKTDAAADGHCIIFELPPLPKGKNFHELEIKGRGIHVKYRIDQ